MSPIEVDHIEAERVFPNAQLEEQAIALSLIDATTVDFSTSCAIWLCEKPAHQGDQFNLFDHFRQSLKITFNAYPQWCGLLKGISTLDPAKAPSETHHFAPHARRYGRVYVHFGTPQDPGVEFVTAKTTATLDDLSPVLRQTEEPIYDRQKVPLNNLVPSVRIANAIRSSSDETSLLPPLVAVQITQLACGGFALAAKIGHPLADIQSLTYFIKDLASVSRWIISGAKDPAPVLEPIFVPEKLDNLAAGDINAESPDPKVMKQVDRLPMHRYDWWISTVGCPWEAVVPDEYKIQDITPAGKSMPWAEWDSASPVSHYVIHLTRDQVEILWRDAVKDSPHERGVIRISRHDAVLAHIWACIARARNIHEDTGPFYCDLTYGSRAAFHLGQAFVGSPSMMVNIEMTGCELASSDISQAKRISSIAQNIRKTLNQINRPSSVAAHIHSIAYETSPQRIWQAFLGQRHILVTSWARAGIYDIDFGLSPPNSIRYVEGVVADLDGLVLIKEGPPAKDSASDINSWIENGVDVSIHTRAQDMERMIADPLLLPKCD
ncbi:transferase family protein [Penicillium taxi]|uniref:transferase family protein n=1 Tax=Penicillium taxi TaxID=168475 RepID=UPI002544ECCA|nr:transferase family protein [Penicillium taxi]KAJ5907598.1 transferase family protein [Penicillium taxi]